MKRFTTRAITSVALIAVLGLSAPVAAFADSTTTTTTAPSVWKAFHATWKTYVDGIKAINATFHSAVEGARATLKSALESAKTKAERTAARDAFTAALVAALDARVTAITAAGSPPPPPAGYVGTAWISGFQAANQAYRTAVATAQSTFAGAIGGATTKDQRAVVRDTLKLAVANAEVARAAAMAALGTPPDHKGKKL